MHKKRYLWIIFGVVILLSALVSGFILMQPSAEELLVQTLETTKTISTAHAVVEVRADTVEKDGTATIEIWGRRGGDGPGAFRLEVLETSDEEAAGAVAVSDGETLWAYAPSKGKVFVGTLEEAKDIMSEKQLERGDFKEGEPIKIGSHRLGIGAGKLGHGSLRQCTLLGARVGKTGP